MKTQIAISKMVHPQSGKIVESIKILDNEFVYQDKRMFSTWSIIDLEYAKKIIDNFPVKIDSAGKEVFFPDRILNSPLKLTWTMFDENYIELKIHCGSDHVWSSILLKI